MCTVKHVNNDHPWDPEMVAAVDRWSLFRGSVYLKIEIGPFKWWLLYAGGCYSQVAVMSGLLNQTSRCTIHTLLISVLKCLPDSSPNSSKKCFVPLRIAGLFRKFFFSSTTWNPSKGLVDWGLSGLIAIHTVCSGWVLKSWTRSLRSTVP